MNAKTTHFLGRLMLAMVLVTIGMVLAAQWTNTPLAITGLILMLLGLLVIPGLLPNRK